MTTKLGRTALMSACYGMIEAALGDRYDGFARVSVAPETGTCAGDACTTAEGIAGRSWLAAATDRQGHSYKLRCTYCYEVASWQTAGPSPS